MKKINFVVNCEVKILEDWFFGQSAILQIQLETALSGLSGEKVALKLPSRPCIKFRWSGVSF